MYHPGSVPAAMHMSAASSCKGAVPSADAATVPAHPEARAARPQLRARAPARPSKMRISPTSTLSSPASKPTPAACWRGCFDLLTCRALRRNWRSRTLWGRSSLGVTRRSLSSPLIFANCSRSGCSPPPRLLATRRAMRRRWGSCTNTCSTQCPRRTRLPA